MKIKLISLSSAAVIISNGFGQPSESKPPEVSPEMAAVASLRAAFAANKGAKIAIKADSVKVLTPEVVAEKGSTIVTSKSGDESEALYTAIYLKKDGKSKMSQLVETPVPDASPSKRLSQLTWLIGDWNEADKDSGVTVHSHYQWAHGGSFITRNVTV